MCRRGYDVSVISLQPITGFTALCRCNKPCLHQAFVFCNSLASCKCFIVGNRNYRMVSQIYKQNVPNIYKFWKKFPAGYYGPKPARLLVHYHYHHNADKQTPHGTHILCPIFPLKCSLRSKTHVKKSYDMGHQRGAARGWGIKINRLPKMVL